MNIQIPALLCCFLFGNYGFAADLAVGRPAPTIEARLLDGTANIKIGPDSRKVSIVHFWASWCVPCRLEMPAIQSYYEKHLTEGLQVLAISMDDPRDLVEVRKVAKLYSFPIALKSEAEFKGLGRIWRMPATFVIDRQGILRKNGQEGAPTVDLDSLEQLVTPLLKQP